MVLAQTVLMSTKEEIPVRSIFRSTASINLQEEVEYNVMVRTGRRGTQRRQELGEKHTP